jgi:FlaA1/EpsC-like NDP-sugar epimerase
MSSSYYKIHESMRGKKRVLILMAVDAAVLLLSYVLILQRTKFNSNILPSGDIVTSALMMLLCTFIMRFAFRLQRTMWRYASAGVFLYMILADFLAGWLYLVIDRVFFSVHVPFTNAVAAMCVGLTASLSIRFAYQVFRNHPEWLEHDKKPNNRPKEQVAIVGAGQLGVSLARELLISESSHYLPYCFIDKDERKIGTFIEGMPVFSPDKFISRLPSIPVKTIVIALPDLSQEKQQAFFEFYQNTGCSVRIYDFPLNDKKSDNNKRVIRDVKIEDLLFRNALTFTDESTTQAYNNKIVLITGGGGTIGSELARQIAACKPKQLILLDIYENGVYDLQQELLRKYGDELNLKVIIATITDAVQMDYIFQAYKPDIVFHAAAHKHVPLMEESCAEAVRNNVFGTYNVVNSAEKAHVKRFVMISTDKAVNPTNIMGATKRMCEMIIQSRKDSKTQFVAVRFGNVLGSNGSVVPLFKRQIDEGGPVTITDKRIIRYFMLIPEAVQLVLRAGMMKEQAKIYVLDMGKPIKIIDLAENLIVLSGLKPYKDIEIKEIGLRPGEKLYEETLIDTKRCLRTEDQRIFIEPEGGFDREHINALLRGLRNQVDILKENDAVRSLMMQIVPTYKPAEEVNKTAKLASEFQMVADHSYLKMKPITNIIEN